MKTNEMRHRKFLVICENTLADALTVIPALETLKQKRPGIQIDLLAPGLYPIRHAYQSIVTVIDHEPISKLDRKQRFKWLKEQHYQWAWNTENENSHWRRIFEVVNHPTWISAPPNPKRSVLELRRKQLNKLFPEVDHATAPLLELTLEQAQERQSFLSQFAQGFRLIGVQPEIKSPQLLPAEKYMELIGALLKQSENVIILFLRSEEKAIIENSFPKNERLVVITDPVQQIIPQLAACDLFIGPNTGIYHLAFALRYPVIGIFKNRKSKNIWGYRSKRTKAVFPSFPKRKISIKSILKSVDDLLK